MMDNIVNGTLYLVDATSPIVGPGTPLITVDVAEVAVGVGPFIPNAYIVLL